MSSTNGRKSQSETNQVPGNGRPRDLISAHNDLQQPPGNPTRECEDVEQFQQLLDKTECKIMLLKAQQEELENFELYYYEARRQVRLNARELIAKIQEHESRLLEEIDAAKQSEYAKLQFQSEDLDLVIKRLTSAKLSGSAILTSPGNSASEKKREVTKQIEDVDSDQRFDVHSLMKFSVLTFATVRCNTAFGSISLEEMNMNQYLSDSLKKVRNMSTTSAPYEGNGRYSGGKCEKGQRKSRSVSLGTPMHMSQSTPALNVITGGTVTMPSSPQLAKRSAVPLLRHLNMSAALEEKQAFRPGPAAQCLWKLTKDGREPGDISGPNDVDFLPDGNIVVCDRDNKRLQIFDKRGKLVKVIAAGLIKPRRIAVVPDGHIAVTDSSDNTVKVYDQNAECIIIWGKKWYKSIFKAPCGIAINSKEQPIVSDMEKHCVTIYNIEGKKIKTIQGEGYGRSEFHSPSYVAVDCKDRVIVADNWNQSVKVFSANGKFLLQFNKVDGDQRLKYPNGVCADVDGNIYVADWGNHRVSKFDSNGVFQKHLLTREDGLYHPAGLAISGSNIAVTAYSDDHSFVGLYKIRE